MKVLQVGIHDLAWKMICECPDCLATLEISREDLFLKKYPRAVATGPTLSVTKVVCTCASCNEIFSLINFNERYCGKLPHQ